MSEHPLADVMKNATNRPKTIADGGDAVTVWETEHNRIRIMLNGDLIQVVVESDPIVLDGREEPWFAAMNNIPLTIVRKDRVDAAIAEKAGHDRGHAASHGGRASHSPCVELDPRPSPERRGEREMSSELKPIQPEPYPFLFKVCDTVGENWTVELDYLPEGVDWDTSDKVLESAYCAISTSSVKRAMEMVRADERADLWRRADDPEVVEKVAGAIGGSGLPRDKYNSDNIAAAYRAREILLTALLGQRPRPEEQEDATNAQ